VTRLFTFGCSYTHFCWPTWADFLGLKFDEYQNWAQSGGGNSFIIERLIEANATHKFTADDTVIVQWTTHQRHDYFKEGWWAGGNIFTSPFYDEEYINKYFDIKGSVIHTLNYISAAQHLLDNTAATWFMTSMIDLTIPLPEFCLGVSEQYKKDKELDKINSKPIFDTWPELKIYENVLQRHWITPTLTDWCDSTGFKPGGISYASMGGPDITFSPDWHPSPSDHYNWLQHVSKSVPELVPSDKAKDMVDDWNYKFDRHRVISKLSYTWLQETGIRPEVIAL